MHVMMMVLGTGKPLAAQFTVICSGIGKAFIVDSQVAESGGV
jgi:hypothetical protein